MPDPARPARRGATARRSTASRPTTGRSTAGRSRTRGGKARRRASRRNRAGSRALNAALVAVVALTIAAACTSPPDSQPQAGAAPTTSATTPPTTPPPPSPAPVVWPLTGVQTAAVADRPALAVKIENSVDARPQTGLNAADMVWEEVVEGGITRYVAVYHSTLPPQIGPVRSVRPMDPSIAAPLHGLLAFSGGVQGYIAAARDAGLQVVSQDAGARGFRRISSRQAPHNVYADPQALVAQADASHQSAPPAQLDYAAPGQQPTAGSPATSLRLTLSGSSRLQWTWSASDGRWLRAEGSTPAVEADGARLGATNVVVLRVDVVNTAARDPAGNPVPETKLVGTGTALIATAGHTVPATWTKNAVADRVTLTGADGQPVRLAPGTTWVELVPNGTGAVAAG